MGGSGFIGQNLCMSLRKKASAVKCFSKNLGNIDGIEYIKGNFFNQSDVEQAVKDVDILFHLISTTLPANSNAQIESDIHDNILSTVQMLNACKNSSVARIVFASSGGTIYGDAQKIPTPEDYPTNPICSYGISKLAIEKYLYLYERLYGITAISLRISNPFGPYQKGQKSQGVIGTCIIKVLSGECFEIWGDGSVVRDYLYIDDVVRAFEYAAVYPGKFRVFNIGGGEGTSLNDIVALISNEIGNPFQPKYLSQRPVDVHKSILACHLAINELNWHREIDLADGISRTVSWFREQVY